MKKRKKKYSGIGGQAVLEGVMMKNGDEYAVAVRKPDGGIAIEKKEYKGILAGSIFKKMLFVRGCFNFIDSLVLGMSALSYSASFFDDEEPSKKEGTVVNENNDEEKGTEEGEGTQKEKKSSVAEDIFMGFTMVISMVMAVGIFMVLPYFIARFLQRFILNESLLSITEAIIRVLLFVGYVLIISNIKDIHRLYQYHGAEHKCINCIEKGYPLTVKNAKRASRLHSRCGTSFLLFVMFVSAVLFFFIRVEDPVYRILIRIALIPVIAGISYEIIRLAGRCDNFFIRLLSAPGMGLQNLTTKEPDDRMLEIAIASVEAVFDWRSYLEENFDTLPSDFPERRKRVKRKQ